VLGYRIALVSGKTVPLAGPYLVLFHPFTMLKHFSQVHHGLGVAISCGLFQPFQALGLILGHANASEIHPGDIHLSLGVSPVGSLAVPDHGFIPILFHAAP